MSSSNDETPVTPVTYSIMFFESHLNVFDLKSEIKRIMFDGENMRPISTERDLFTMIMATFSQYEKMVSVTDREICFTYFTG